jgi:hypothetical protein
MSPHIWDASNKEGPVPSKIVRYAVVISSFAVLAPAWASAQTPIPVPSVSTPPPVATPLAPKSATHLQKSRELLAAVPDNPAGKDAAKRIAALKKSFAEMTRVYTGPAAIVPHGDTPVATDNPKDQEKAVRNWKDLFSEVERDVTRVIGAGSRLGTATGGAEAAAGTVVQGGAVPTISVGTIAKVDTIGIENLDPQVVRQIEAFRTELELFYTEALTEGSRSLSSS